MNLFKWETKQVELIQMENGTTWINLNVKQIFQVPKILDFLWQTTESVKRKPTKKIDTVSFGMFPRPGRLRLRIHYFIKFSLIPQFIPPQAQYL